MCAVVQHHVVASGGAFAVDAPVNVGIANNDVAASSPVNRKAGQ
jgi:hypothetical protein